jgi:hypothetical protein
VWSLSGYRVEQICVRRGVRRARARFARAADGMWKLELDGARGGYGVLWICERKLKQLT